MTKDELVYAISEIVDVASISSDDRVVLAASVLCTLAGVLEGGGSMVDLSNMTVAFSMYELERIEQMDAAGTSH